MQLGFNLRGWEWCTVGLLGQNQNSVLEPWVLSGLGVAAGTLGGGAQSVYRA